MKNFYIGEFKKDAADPIYKGWFVGEFMKDEPRKNNQLEVKYWEFKKGKTTHPTKISETIECTIVLEGSMKGEVGQVPITLSKGEYIVIHPGIENNITQEALSDIKGFTIKAPSIPNAKKIVG